MKKYYKIIWWEGDNTIQIYGTSTMNGYKKNKLIISSHFFMLTDDQDKGYEKFKKDILKHLNNKINQINNATLKYKL
jgi:hypothetical protein